ncbi:MAG: hypothetical protein IT339_03735 [Thermomicrobiales bacterium]|nr:hypothetical protein [Thermomicrobiales bacterium]
MSESRPPFTRRQLVFAELAVGTLIYAVVLGLFDDYTDLVDAKSFSTIVFASMLLEVLTFLTFLFKDWWIGFLTSWRGELSRPQKLFGLWLVMFFSKFVFLWAIEFVFQGNFEVGGFFSVLILVTCVTVLAKLANAFFVRLGAPEDVLN